MKNIIKALKIIFISILVFILLINIIIIIKSKINPNEVPGIFGYKPFVVTSGSMEKEIGVGDLVFVKTTNPNELEVNDIIAFRDTENFVTTHRIVEKLDIQNKTCFRTKGDANNTIDDMSVCEGQIEGKYVFKISLLGNVILFIQEPLGFIVMMLIILIIGMFIFFGTNKNNNTISKEELKEFEEFKKSRRVKQDVK